jgi:Zn-dependent alcohol dehydrogenase
VYGSGDPVDALPPLLDAIERGEIALAPLVRAVYPLERIDEAIEASLAGAPGRVVVEP